MILRISIIVTYPFVQMLNKRYCVSFSFTIAYRAEKCHFLLESRENRDKVLIDKLKLFLSSVCVPVPPVYGCAGFFIIFLRSRP